MFCKQENDEALPNDNPVGRVASLLFVAGDSRANEQPGLIAFHTLFVREHNRLCDEYKSTNPQVKQQHVVFTFILIKSVWHLVSSYLFLFLFFSFLFKMCTVGLYASLCLMIFLCPFLHCKALRTAMYKRYINSIIIIIIIIII